MHNLKQTSAPYLFREKRTLRCSRKVVQKCTGKPPRDFAARIRGGEISGASVARNFLAAAVLASVLQAVLKLPPLTPIDIPYLSDVVVLTISTLAAVLFIIPFHFALNLGKRGVRVRDAAILMI